MNRGQERTDARVFTVLRTVIAVLLFVVVILAIMAMIKWLFPRSNPFL
jgi:hypothetical protein